MTHTGPVALQVKELTGLAAEMSGATRELGCAIGAFDQLVESYATKKANTRIAAYEVARAEQDRATSAEHADQIQRLEDLTTEMKRQLDAALKGEARWAYVAQYAPESVRRATGWGDPRADFTLLNKDWCARVHQAAAQPESPDQPAN